METYIIPDQTPQEVIEKPQHRHEQGITSLSHSHAFFLVVTTIVSLLIGLIVGFALGSRVSPWDDLVRQPIASPNILPAQDSPNTFCTMDTKLCADGSSVGRVGPKCEFAPCPENVSSSTSATTSADRAIPLQTAGTCVNSALNLKVTLPANTTNWSCESDQTELLVSSVSGVNMLFSNQVIDNPCGPGTTCTLQPFYQGNGLVLNSYTEANVVKQIYGSFPDGTWAMITWTNMDTQPLATADKNQLISILTSIKKGATPSASPAPLR